MVLLSESERGIGKKERERGIGKEGRKEGRK